MNKNTIKATQESISIWKINIALSLDELKKIKIGADQCPLCWLFVDGICVDCPIYEAGKGCCKKGSTYSKAFYCKKHNDLKGFRQNGRRLIKIMEDSLK